MLIKPVLLALALALPSIFNAQFSVKFELGLNYGNPVIYWADESKNGIDNFTPSFGWQTRVSTNYDINKIFLGTSIGYWNTNSTVSDKSFIGVGLGEIDNYRVHVLEVPLRIGYKMNFLNMRVGVEILNSIFVFDSVEPHFCQCNPYYFGLRVFGELPITNEISVNIAYSLNGLNEGFDKYEDTWHFHVLSMGLGYRL